MDRGWVCDLLTEGMPQMQLPIFPAGVTEINNRVAVEAKEGQVCYMCTVTCRCFSMRKRT